MGTRTIAANKLTIPSSSRALVARESLIPRLDDRFWHVSAVSAPAGFGKTTLLSTWAAAHQDHTVWLTCDSADREPLRFWTGLIASMSARWPGIGDDALALLERTGGEDRDAAVGLANDLSDLHSPVTLVIDDLHLAKPAPPVLSAFVGALPATARVVLGSRLTTPFPLSRLRVAGRLLEIQSEELRFSVDETRSLIEQQELELDPREIERLHTLTEGWPAAVQLAAMSLKRHPDRRQFLDALALTDQAIAEFLVNEVLHDLPETWLDFLVSTCVLDEFDVDLCVRMTGRDDAGAILQDLHRAGLFLVALDDTGTWFRYHHLFGSFMRSRTRSLGAARYVELNRRASEAMEARGLFVAAMRMAFAHDDTNRAAELVRRSLAKAMHTVDTKLSGSAARLWLHEHGEALASTHPVLVLEMVATLTMTSGADDVARWLTYVERATSAPTPVVTAHLHGIWAEHLLLRGRPTEARHHVETAMAVYGGEPPNDGLLPLLFPVEVRANLDAGDVDRARAVCDRARSRSRGNGVLDRVRLPALQAWIAYLDGELTTAEQLARDVDHDAEELEVGDNEPGCVYSALVLASVHAERMRDEEARTAFETAARVADSLQRAPFQSVVALRRAHYARTIGDTEGAASYLDLARGLLPSASADVVARFERETRLQALHHLPHDVGLPGEGLDDFDELGATVRHLIEQGDLTTAAALVSRMPTPHTARQRLETALIRVLLAPGVDEAMEDIGVALEIAAREGFVRTIIGAGSAVPKVLAAVPAGTHDELVAELLDAAVTLVTSSTARIDAVPLVEPLSPSELSVLRYLSSRLSNHDIAAALHISINTLKTHVKTVYRKLGVSSRADAVAMGRQHRVL